MVRDLLKAGANVNARDGRLLTPLHFAVATEYASQQICETLLQAGADANARDNTGETPLDWAEKFAYPEIVQALRKAGAKHGDTAYRRRDRRDRARDRALQAYSIPARRTEFDARIARARAWLQRVKPATTDDYAMRLLGLARAGASKSEMARAVGELVALQGEDGGWSGNPYLNSEAFSTGEAWAAQAIALSIRPPAIRAGLRASRR